MFDIKKNIKNTINQCIFIHIDAMFLNIAKMYPRTFGTNLVVATKKYH